MDKDNASKILVNKGSMGQCAEKKTASIQSDKPEPAGAV